MAKTAKKKPSAKKAKRKPPKVTPEKRLRYPPLSPEEEAEWGQYWKPWTSRKVAEARAYIDRILAAQDNVQPVPTRADVPSPPDEAPPPSPSPPETKRRRPGQEVCWRSFGRLFLDKRIPDEVELSTVDLRTMIEADLKCEAEKAVADLKRAAEKVGAKPQAVKPPATPSLPTVTSARRDWPR